MSESKPFASLTSGLLARKGGAKPAMRRQGMAFEGPSADHDHDHDQNEDLGWNDMGYDTNPDHEAGDHPNQSAYTANPLAGAIPHVVPEVRKQQEEIAAKLSMSPIRAEPAQAAPRPKNPDIGEEKIPVPLSISREVAPVAEQSSIGMIPPRRKKVTTSEIPAKASRPAVKSRTRKAKAAFTLRLDPERHLKLRLATAVKNVSAQQLVTKAVDEYLKNIPELDELAARIPSRGVA